MSYDSEMTALADAIRSKANITETLTVSAMRAAVEDLSVGGGITPDVQTLSVTPTKEQQTFTSSDLGENAYYGTVTVFPIPAEYITTTDATAAAGDILNGKTAYVNGQKVTGTISTVTATLSGNVVTVPAGHIASKQTLTVPEAQAPTLSENTVTVHPGYIRETQTVTVGTAKGAQTFTPGTSDQTINAGNFLTGKQTIKGDANLTADNIKTGVSIFNVEGTFTADATATAADIAKGKTAYTAAGKTEGTAAFGGSMDFYKCTAVFGPKKITFLTVSGAGTEDCNGRYDDTGRKKNNQPVYSYLSPSGTTWFIYYIDSEWDVSGWVLTSSADADDVWYTHYYSSSLSSQWNVGEAGASEPAPTVTQSSEIINSDQPKTWNGRKAMPNDDGTYSFDKNVTEGLSYGTAFTPTVGFIYNPACTIWIKSLYAQALCTAIKIQIDRLKSSGAGVQMSEFILVDHDGNAIDWSSLPISSVTANAGNNSPSGQEPEKIIDGNIETKWFSWNFGAPSFVQINFNYATSLKYIAGYRWHTAEDTPGRDPVSWKVLLLNKQGEWEVVSEVIDYPVTGSRRTLVGTWDFNF